MDKERDKQPDICEEYTSDTSRIDEFRNGLATIHGLSEIFRVLGDETRTRIVWALSQRELCVCDIANLLGVSSSLVSHNLRLLRNLRLVKYRKEGKQAFYALDDSHIVQMIRAAIEHYQEQHVVTQ